MKQRKKNCHNCKNGYWDSDWDEYSSGTHEYFVCEKRDAGDDIKLQNNFERPEYLEKVKRCCELKSIS